MTAKTDLRSSDLPSSGVGGNGSGWPNRPSSKFGASVKKPWIGWAVAVVLLIATIGVAAGSPEDNSARLGSLTAQLGAKGAESDQMQGEIDSLTSQLQRLQAQLDDTESELATALAHRPLPRFVGQDRLAAEDMASTLGWDLVIKQQESSKPVGRILSQKPSPGTMMRLGAEFTIAVAKPLPPKMPNLIGKKLSAAKNLAQDRGWELSVQRQAFSQPVGTIISQTPTAGTFMRGAAKFTVVVAKAPPAPPTSSPGSSGSSAPSNCHPSYSGACLDPSAEDYDCAGGSGNGPYYVEGPVYVSGSDPYGLDSDGDGVACES
jgi:hypothetical protein